MINPAYAIQTKGSTRCDMACYSTTPPIAGESYPIDAECVPFVQDPQDRRLQTDVIFYSIVNGVLVYNDPLPLL